MKENLAYLPVVHSNSEFSTQANNQLPGYGVYGYNGSDVATAKSQANYTTHGVLYNWFATNQSGVNAICPAGWSIPSDTQWNILEQYVVSVINSLNPQYPCSTSETTWRRCADNTGTDMGANGVGRALKELGLGIDLVGFSSKLSGSRGNIGSFYVLSSHAFFWSSTPSSTLAYAWCRYLSGFSTIYRGTDTKTQGYSVRCLKN